MVSLRYKALLPAGLLGAVLVTVAALAHLAINELTDANVSLAGRYHEIEEVRHIEINVNQLVYPLVDALTTGSVETRQIVREKLAEVRDSIEDLRQMAVVNSAERRLLDNIENRLTHIEAITASLLDLPPQAHETAMAMLQDLSAYQLGQLSEVIHAWHDDEARQVNKLQETTLLISEQFRLWVGGLGALLAGWLIFALWLNNRILVKPVITISESTSRLAAGELEAAIQLRTNDELTTLATDINTMAASLQAVHKRLEAMANNDVLTGLPNRRALDVALVQELDAAQRYGRPFALCILDVDHFKRINDTHGHHVGDEVLRAVAQTTAATLRQSDRCFRYGGEEFVLLLQQTDPERVKISMERCRQALANTPIRVGDLELQVTASLGAACCPSDATTAESLLELADAALYAAKNDGRNRSYRHCDQRKSAPSRTDAKLDPSLPASSVSI